VTVNREDEHEHLHSIEDSFQVKKLVTILAVAKEEHAKNLGFQRNQRCGYVKWI
jgi:hypothetical protein